MSTAEARIPRLWPYLLVCAAVALCVPVGRFQRGSSADSILLEVISLQHWTPFYWGMDRMGMLVPLLAIPIRSPLANLLFQNAVCVFATLSAMVLLPRYLLRDASYPLVGLVSAAAFLALTPLAYCFDFTVNTFYGVWLAAGLGALVLAEDGPSGRAPLWRLLLALGLLVLAHWEYTGTALVLGPIVVFRQLWGRPSKRLPGERNLTSGIQTFYPFFRIGSTFSSGTSSGTDRPAWMGHVLNWGRRVLNAETTIAMLLLGSSVVMGLAFMHWARDVYPYGRTVVGSQPSADWPAMWRRLAVNAWNALAPQYWPWFLAGVLAAGFLLLGVPAVRRRSPSAWRAGAVLISGATVYFFFMGTRRWTELNGCNFRYSHPVIFLLQGAVVILALAPLATALPGRVRTGLCGLAAGCLVLAALTTYHPSLRASHAVLDGYMGSCTEDILAARCTHVAGNYWNVWPAVYHANLILHERHENRMVWGITGRSEITRQLWEKVPLEEWRIAVPVDAGPNAEGVAGYFNFPPAADCGAYPRLPGQTERVLAYFHLPSLVVVEKRRTIWVLQPQAVVDSTLSAAALALDRAERREAEPWK